MIPNRTFFLKRALSLGLLMLNLSAYADEFGYQYRSARYLGRGDTGIASTTGVDAMFYNPAGIAQSGKPFQEAALVSPQGEGSDNLLGLYEKRDAGSTELLKYVLNNRNNPFYAAAQNADAVIFRNLGFGAMQRGQVLALVNTDYYTGQPYVKLAASSWNGGYVSMNRDFLSGRLLLGITGKFVQKTQYALNLTATQIDNEIQNSSLVHSFENTKRTGRAVGGDFGSMLVLHKASETHVGLVVRNVGMSYTFGLPPVGKAPDSDQQQTDAAISTSFGTKKSRIKLFADYKDIFNQQGQNYFKHTHLGMEYNLDNFLGVMTGLNQGYTTLGLALNFKLIRAEAGTYIEEIGDIPGQTPSVRYFGRISAGWFL